MFYGHGHTDPPVAILDFKKWGDQCWAKGKSRGWHYKCISCMV